MMLNFIFDVLFSVLCMHFIKFFFQIYVLSSFFFITEDTGSIHAGNLWKIICQSTVSIEVNVINESSF